jgi:hypothetical protein
MAVDIEPHFKNSGLNKTWFSQTTKCIPMVSCIYFTATRNITASDVVHVFENVLNLGKVSAEYVNIVPVLDKNYNHVFLKIQWNDAVETANFVNEFVINSFIKVYHNKGYWVCRMSKNPLKMRTSKRCVKFASFYCDSDTSESESEEQNVRMQVKEIEATEEDAEGSNEVSRNEEEAEVSRNEEEAEVSRNEEEDFYVIKEISQNAIVE